MKSSATPEDLRVENAKLRRRLEEAEETLLALRTGVVDALVVDAHDALRATEQQLQLVADTAPVFIAHCDAEGRYKFVNQPYARRFGLTPAECIGRRIPEVVGEIAFAAFRSHVENVLRGQKAEFEMDIPYDLPGRRFMHCSYVPEIGPDGAVVGFIAAITDISARKEAEEALRLSDMRKSAILTSALDCLICMDHEGRITDWNPAAERTFGYSRDEAMGRTVAETIIPPGLREAHHRGLTRFLTTGEFRVLGKRVELTAMRADGSEFLCELAITATRVDGASPFFTAYLRDITERKQAEDQLRRNHDTFFALIQNAPFGVYVVDSQFRMLQISAGCQQAFRTIDPLLGRDFAEILRIIWEESFASEAIAHFRHTLETGEPYGSPNTAEQRHDTGEIEAYDWKIERVILPDGQPGVVCYFYDITARRAAEEALRESEQRYRVMFATAESARVSAEAAKLRAEGAARAKDDFLAALSHELRTPLNPALLLATSLADDQGVPPSVRENLATIARGISLQVRLVDDLLDVTRITGGKLRLELRPMDAHEALRQALEMVDPEIRERQINVLLDLAATQHSIHADPVRIQQVFWNVLKNAVKFTPSGGAIAVRTLIPSHKPEVLVVEVTDTGIGIAPGMVEKIFDSFAQEHHEGAHRFGGLGLGLAISRRLVEMHHGSISARSAGRDCGATFCVEMPLSIPGHDAADPDTSPADSSIPRASRHILLAEDHDMTRETLVRLLERRGHTVVAASSAAQARELAAAGGCDLLISDLGLPDGDGHTLMKGLYSKYGLPGIAMSGYGAEEDLRRSHESGFFAHLTKPVGIHALEQAIAAAPPAAQEP